MACDMCNQGRGAMFADKYLRHVVWKGREGAYRWGLKQYRKALLRKGKDAT